jgi:transcriptional regulator with XRE-family HTH domain
MLYRIALGHALRTERNKQGLSLRAVCKGYVSIAHLSDVERGRQEISSELLVEVCKGLNVPIHAILEQTVQVLKASQK